MKKETRKRKNGFSHANAVRHRKFIATILDRQKDKLSDEKLESESIEVIRSLIRKATLFVEKQSGTCVVLSLTAKS